MKRLPQHFLSDMRCGGLHCRAKGSHLATDHLFWLLKQRLGGYRLFHNNEKVAMAVREKLPTRQPNFFCDETQTHVTMGQTHRCVSGIVLKN